MKTIYNLISSIIEKPIQKCGQKARKIFKNNPFLQEKLHENLHVELPIKQQNARKNSRRRSTLLAAFWAGICRRNSRKNFQKQTFLAGKKARFVTENKHSKGFRCTENGTSNCRKTPHLCSLLTEKRAGGYELFAVNLREELQPKCAEKNLKRKLFCAFIPHFQSKFFKKMAGK